MHMANTTQWMIVLTTPIDVYLMNSFNIIKISEFLEGESLTSSMLMIDSCCLGKTGYTKLLSDCNALHASV